MLQKTQWTMVATAIAVGACWATVTGTLRGMALSAIGTRNVNTPSA